MNGKVTNCIAKKNCEPYFKIGDSIKIHSILYAEDTIIHHGCYGLNVKGEPRISPLYNKSMVGQKDKHGNEVIEIIPPTIAPKGTYKDSIIEVNDTSKYPSSIVRSYQDYFEKI